MANKKIKNKKKKARIIDLANLYIKSSFNNTMLSACDENGDVFAWATAGKAGFKGTKKSTPFAATQAARAVIDRMREFQVREIKVYVSGVSTGRDAALRAFGNSGFKISSIKDTTPIPHNGCRAKKPRRV